MSEPIALDEQSGQESLGRSERRFLTALLLLILALVSADVFTDFREGVHLRHLLVELTIAAGAGAGALWLMRKSFEARRELRQSLQQSNALIKQKELEAERWRSESAKYLNGLSQAIDDQLSRWSLTLSEKEIALLLLKGLSVKEIANIRKTNEKTVRAQAVSIYAKSGLAGRSELAAFFLEDLLVPAEARDTHPVP